MERHRDEGLTSSNARRRSEEYIASIAEYPDSFHGRGIVVCGGGQRYFTNAWISISLLRHVGCGLPVQLWYLGRDEMDPYMEGLIAPLGVECIDAHSIRALHPARILNGWEVKPYAILHSPFREVMLLDADNFVAANPEPLFDTWEYRDTGALFWPDLGRLSADNPAWFVFGVPYRDEPEIESGQIVVNKETCWKALCLTKFYNDYSDFYYRYVHGDKETFHFAFRKLDVPYAMPDTPVRHEEGTFFHSDFAGNTIFQHRSGPKWSYEGDNARLNGFRYEDECRHFLEQLRAAWDGTVGNARDRLGPADLAAARSELTSAVYRYQTSPSTYRPMSFASDGHIGLGARVADSAWNLRISGNKIVLEIDGAANANGATEPEPRSVLVRDASGVGWHSASGESRLVPIPRKTGAFTNAPLSLNEFVERVGIYAKVGFAWAHYALSRDYRPDVAIAIASLDSAAALAVARGVQDNGRGECILIEPVPDVARAPGSDRCRSSRHAAEAEKWFSLFGLHAGGRIRYLPLREDAALAIARDLAAGKGVGLLLMDCACTMQQDTRLEVFDAYSSLISAGVALLHDGATDDVASVIRALRARGVAFARLDVDSGLTLVPLGQHASASMPVVAPGGNLLVRV